MQNINHEIVTPPTFNIVSVEEAKTYIRQDNDIEDDLVEMLIKGATGKIEIELGGVAICEKTIKQTQTGGIDKIRLSIQPIIDTPTITYYESFGTETGKTLEQGVDFRTVKPNILLHKDGYFKKGRLGDGYTITYNAGLYTASNYESTNCMKQATLKTAILRTVAWLYEQRQEFQSGYSEGEWSSQYNQMILGRLLPIGIKHLIMPFHCGEGLV